MDEPAAPLSADRLADLLDENASDEAIAHLRRFEAASTDERKAALEVLRARAEDDPEALEPLLSALEPFLAESERPVRLSTAKLLVRVADAEPDAVVPLGPALADRLADDDEFYFVRARAAEALGYVALEHPDAVVTPAVLADLRVGLSFDEPEVAEKLAKALECVALGDPGRLRHHVEQLAGHLDGEAELVRYHLTTVLAAIGCEHPRALAAGRDALVTRLDDECAHVRGRAAEALGLLARSSGADAGLEIDLERLLDDPTDDDPTDDDSFVADRARFAADASAEGARPDGVGTVDALRETTDEAVEAITAPDAGCPHCGLALPDPGPSMCPRCGAPR